MRVPEEQPGPFSFAGLVIIALSLLTSGRALANGAFPDAQNILTPEDRPLEILMATTFGMVLSQDGGRTWLWTCEQNANQLGYLYQMGLPPRHRVFTLANKALAYSDDLTCGWRVSGGAVVGQEISDAWVDQALPDRVLAVGVTCCAADKNSVYSLFESSDGGTTFGAARYAAAPGDVIKGVESSVSQPRIIYMTMSVAMAMSATTTKYVPVLARSSDGGASWVMNDLTASLGNGNMRLIGVDSQDPNKVFLLWNDPVNGQALVVTEDGGATASIRPQPTAGGGVIRAFARTATDALLMATDPNGTGALYRSVDGGITFEAVPGPPHIRGLSRRGAVVYAATDNFADGFAAATSLDDGSTWSPLMSYEKVRAIAGCVQAVCRDMCQAQAGLLWPAAVCSAATANSGGCSVSPASIVQRQTHGIHQRVAGGVCCSESPLRPSVDARWAGSVSLLGIVAMAALGSRSRRRRRRDCTIERRAG